MKHTATELSVVFLQHW